ncbi:HD domain-containing protein [Candidatus Daviesbacteria bacterium]|nr:HD domain-containing protein [Candidatus Daviesbacteria bacterium]
MAEENIDTSSHTGGENEKRRAWSSWAIKHFGEMRLAKTAGLFPKEAGWRNVVEHSLVVNALAVYLAKKIAKAGPPVNTDLVDSASILHDVAKRRDKESGISRDNERSAGATRELLEQDGYSEEVIRAAEYTGRVPEIYLAEEEQKRAIKNSPIEALIVAYADARVRNTNIVSLEEARDKNKEKIPNNAAFYDKWYSFYQKVEERLTSLAGISPLDLSEQNVFEMVKSDKN